MQTPEFKDVLLREIESLPEERREEVLAFIRFLKIGLADPQLVDRKFDEALARARTIAQERGIAEADIEAEITAIRIGK